MFSAAALALLMLCVRALPAFASLSLEAIRFEAVSPNEERVVFRLTGPAQLNAFPMKNGSPRLVFDFNGATVSKRVKNSTEAGGKLIERIRVGIHDSKARVVLDLVPGRQVKTAQQPDPVSNTVTVVVYDAAAPSPQINRASAAASSSAAAGMIWSPEKTQTATPPPVRQPPPVAEKTPEPPPVKPAVVKVPAPPSGGTVLSSVLFEKNSNRGEMVMFRLNKFHPPVVFGLEEKKPRVVCDFQDTGAGERLPESVSADGKYVRGIRIERDDTGRKIRAVLDLAPNNSYDLQQVFFKNDNLFVLIINTLGNPAKRLN